MNRKHFQIIGCLFFSFLCSTSFAQENRKVQQYNGIFNSDKQKIFSENFEFTIDDWMKSSNSQNEIYLHDGNLFLKSEKQKILVTRKININENKDFQIEAELKFITGNSKRAFGIQWGRSESGDAFFSFMINSVKQLAISKFSGAYINYKTLSNVQEIKPNDFNKLTIRKINNTVYFFLNEQLIYHMEYNLGYGNYIALTSTGENKVAVKNVNIHEIVQRSINKTPDIFITSPVLVNTFAVIDKIQGEITLRGFVKDESIINTISLNGKAYPVSKDGNFVINYKYDKNTTKLELKVQDEQLLTGKELINLKRVIEHTNGNKSKQPAKNPVYHALIIGVNDYYYDNVPDLWGPIKDAERLRHILTTYYTFENENVTFLKNPKRGDLITIFDSISDKINVSDNLLIFYAGHGYWDFGKEIGYWLPSDADAENTSNWFRNSTLKTYISSIKTRNILLIADACFSGSIFRTRSIFGKAPAGIWELYALPCRKAMTSGNLKEVPDDSKFLKYLTKRLIDNKEKFITSEKLFYDFRSAVISNTENIPQFGTIKNSGDEGGDFIFIRKGK